MPDSALVERLVGAFRRNLDDLLSPSGTEATLRLEYLDDFWRALDWDVGNRQRKPHAERDVIAEPIVGTVEAQRVHSRRPDYVFRIDGYSKFIVEAKKPSIDIVADADAVFQTKTYAWSAGIPFAILTNFHRFRLFDCTSRPIHGEPDRGLVRDFDLAFEDYVSHWDSFCRTFGRAAVADGSLETLFTSLRRRRAGRRVRPVDRLLLDLPGTERVDRAFLTLLEQYRQRLAQDLYENNRGRFNDAASVVGAARLTSDTQRILDRLVFMRVCEDRGITRPEDSLREILQEASDSREEPYEVLRGRFRDFDVRFNGYLFKEHESERLRVSGELLSDFIRELYPPFGPYRFDAIGDDILGRIYESFLGSVVRVHGRSVVIEPKPEVQHAGGVYYTPRFIVDSIIRRTVAEKVRGRTPLQVLEMRLLDPACGSGSFLVAAYQALMDYCEEYVNTHEGWTNGRFRLRGRIADRTIAALGRDERLALTPEFKAALLSSSIFGLDIDQQAVEVSIMSLYLKMLEAAPPRSWTGYLVAGSQLLPVMDTNVRCGNALIDPVAFDQWWYEAREPLLAPSEEVTFRVNAFDWRSDTLGFGRAFRDGGFACVIGNPPYIRVQELTQTAPEQCDFLKWKYPSAAEGNFDIYVAFLERGLQLLAPDGVLGFIMPSRFWVADYGAAVRGIVAEGGFLRSVVDFRSEQVFHGVTTYTAIQVFRRGRPARSVHVARFQEFQDPPAQCRAIDAGEATAGVTIFEAEPPRGSEKWYFAGPETRGWLSRVVGERPRLGALCARIAQGIVTSLDAVYFLVIDGDSLVSRASGSRVSIEAQIVHPLLKGSVHMKRWAPCASNLAVLFPYEEHENAWRLIPEARMRERFPLAWRYLASQRGKLEARERGARAGRPDWYGYLYPKNLDVMEAPKVLSPSLARRGEFSVDRRGEYFFAGSGGGGGGGYGIVLRPDAGIDLQYLCAILNSRLIDHLVGLWSPPFEGGWRGYGKQTLEELPIVVPSTGAQRSLAARIAETGADLARMTREAREGSAADVRSVSARAGRVSALESRLEGLVFELYGVGEPPADA